MPHHLPSSSRPARLPAARPAFTIIEILVVVAIIAALIAILVPSLSKVPAAAKKAAAKHELSAIQSGLQTYFNLFHIYPPSAGSDTYLGTVKGRSPAMLAQGLLGYLDANGPSPSLGDGAGPSNTGEPPYGFRTRKNTMGMGGEIYGPYMQTDPKVLKKNSTTDQVFIDPWGHEILYFVPQASTATLVFKDSSSSTFIFDTTDCDHTYDNTLQYNNTSSPFNPSGSAKFMTKVNGNSSNTSSGTVKGASTYLLISAGPDGIYFTADDIVWDNNGEN